LPAIRRYYTDLDGTLRLAIPDYLRNKPSVAENYQSIMSTPLTESVD